MLDRFGPIPGEVSVLLETVKLRWLAEGLGFEKLVLKKGQMKCYFLPSTNEQYFRSDIFGNIMRFIQTQGAACKIKEHKKRLILTIANINSIEKAKKWLSDMKI